MEELKLIERKSLDRQEALKETDKPKAKPKEGKSPFDELLEQSRQLGQKLAESKTQTKTATREALQDADKLKERQKDRSKDSEKEEDHKHDSKGERKEGDEVHKKVVGKSDLSKHQGDSHSGSSGQGGSSHKKGDRSSTDLKKLTLDKGQLTVGSNQFAKEFRAKLAQATHSLPKTVPQEILNQVIQYARVGILRDGTKVVNLHCHDEVFKGLRLRFESRDGKVGIEFLTANAQTRAFFEKETKTIREKLEAKGIVVENIVVA